MHEVNKNSGGGGGGGCLRQFLKIHTVLASYNSNLIIKEKQCLKSAVKCYNEF